KKDDKDKNKDDKDKKKEETSEDDKDKSEKEAKEDEKQNGKETESKTDTQQEEYQQMPHPYGYQGSMPQYPPNPQGIPGYHYTPPYNQAAYGHSQRSHYGPIRPGSRRNLSLETGSMSGYTGFSDVEVRKNFVRKTLATSVLMGTLSSFFKTNAIIIAIGVCAVVCFTVIPFSFYTKAMTMIYAGFGAIVFIMYLAYDIQMLMGGRHVEINPEEHIFAAIHIYIDVVYIFMFLLMLVGGAQD
ncbi:protein lifeguard 1, partial [Trichonephila inaurata madagascariensis]